MFSNIFVNPNLAPLPTLPPPNAHIRAFHKSLPHYEPTPLVSLPELASQLGVGHVLLKDESRRLGLPAFKIVGASWATARALSERLGIAADPMLGIEALSTVARAADLTLYAATEGNHGRAVARMAKYLGIKARIYVPRFSDEVVRNNLTSEGAEVIVCRGSYDDAVQETKAGAESHPGGNGLLISDTALVAGDEVAQWIVDGYQTIFDEVEEQIARITDAPITHVLSPVGVGSLCQAVVTHFRRQTRPQKPDIITVEPEVAACLKASLRAGEMVSIDAGYTICSGMCCGTVYVFHGDQMFQDLTSPDPQTRGHS